MAESSLRSVLFVTPRWRRDGGIAAHAEASAAALAAQGIEVRVLTAHVGPGEAGKGISVIQSPALIEREAPIEARLGDAPATVPDVIHLHQMDDPDIVAALRPYAPVAISAHGFTACTSDVYYFRPGQECTRHHGPGCVPNLALRGCAHTHDPRPLPGAYRRTTRAVQALRMADLTIAYGSSVDRHLAANAIERRRVIPLFATLEPVTEAIAPAAGTALADAATGGTAERARMRRVLFAGRVVPQKGLHVLVRAAREVDAEFVVCGDGWQLPRIERLARRLGVAERFRFRGWLTPDELARELAQACVVTMPSLWPEPFGLVGIEALASGRPVVASATGGIPDWLTDEVSGSLVPPGSAQALAAALNELLDDPQRCASMGEAGRADVARRFSRERHVEEILRAYAEIRARWKPTALTAA